MNENIKVISKRLTVLGAAALMLGTAAFTALPAAENGITLHRLAAAVTQAVHSKGRCFFVLPTSFSEKI